MYHMLYTTLSYFHLNKYKYILLLLYKLHEFIVDITNYNYDSRQTVNLNILVENNKVLMESSL